MFAEDKEKRVSRQEGEARRIHVPDPRFVYAEEQYLLLRMPAQCREVSICINGSHVERLKAPLPPLVLLAERGMSGSRLRVFSLKTNSTLKKDTRLYHAPLMNVDSRGVLSLGGFDTDPREPDGLDGKDADQWVALVTDRLYTHIENPLCINLGRDPVFTYSYLRAVRNQHNAGETRFPKDLLKETGIRLGDLCV